MDEVMTYWETAAGNHWLPRHIRLRLELLDERRFSSGVVHLHYRT